MREVNALRDAAALMGTANDEESFAFERVDSPLPHGLWGMERRDKVEFVRAIVLALNAKEPAASQALDPLWIRPLREHEELMIRTGRFKDGLFQITLIPHFTGIHTANVPIAYLALCITGTAEALWPYLEAIVTDEWVQFPEDVQDTWSREYIHKRVAYPS